MQTGGILLNLAIYFSEKHGIQEGVGKEKFNKYIS